VTPSIAGDCPTCNQAFTVEFSIEPRPNFLKCPTCEQAWDFGVVPLEGCPICGCRYFYRQKDFNQLLGCAVVLLGAVVVPAVTGYFLGYRYLLVITICSLSVFTGVDALLYRQVSDMAICYDCRCEFRGFEIPPAIVNFEHFLAERFEKEN